MHQLRFRNIGGLIIIDLIDMESRRTARRSTAPSRMRFAGQGPNEHPQDLGARPGGDDAQAHSRSLVQTLCEPCSYCEGRGYMLSGETVAYNILREIKSDLPRFGGRRIAITVSPRVAEQLLSVESEPLDVLAKELGREIEVRARPGLHQEQFEVQALDEGPPVEISLRWLRDPAEIAAEEAAEKKRADARKGDQPGKRRGRGRGRGRGRSEDGEESKAANGLDEQGDEALTDAAGVAEPAAEETAGEATVPPIEADSADSPGNGDLPKSASAPEESVGARDREVSVPSETRSDAPEDAESPEAVPEVVASSEENSPRRPIRLSEPAVAIAVADSPESDDETP